MTNTRTRSSKSILSLLIICVLLIASLIIPRNVEAATKPYISSLTASKSTYNPAAGNQTFTYLIKKQSAKMTVKLDIKNSAGKVVYTKTTKDVATGSQKTITWNGKKTDGTYAPNGSYKAALTVSYVSGGKTLSTVKNKSFTVKAVNPTISYYTLSKTSGFDPRTSNLTIKYKYTNIGVSMVMRLRVLDSKNKVVFTYKAPASKGGTTVSYTWKGRTSEDNQIGLPANTLVPTGTYKVEYYLSYALGTKTYAATKTKSLGIKLTGTTTTTTTTTTASSSLTNKKMILTGIDDIDFIAEQYCKKMGIKSTMSEEQMVKAIYVFIRDNFVHDDNWANKKSSHPLHYNLSSTTVINNRKAYLDQQKKLIAAGKARTGDFRVKRVSNGALYQLATVEQFNRMTGECNSAAYLFMVLCNHVGIRSGVYYGVYHNSDGSNVNHWWPYAYINNVIRVYDPDVESKWIHKKALSNRYDFKSYGAGFYWYGYTKTQEAALKIHTVNYIKTCP